EAAGEGKEGEEEGAKGQPAARDGTALEPADVPPGPQPPHVYPPDHDPLRSFAGTVRMPRNETRPRRHPRSIGGVVEFRGHRRPAGPLASRSDEFVNQVFEHLLPPAGVLCRLALGYDVRLEVGEGHLARLDPPAELTVPAPV